MIIRRDSKWNYLTNNQVNDQVSNEVPTHATVGRGGSLYTSKMIGLNYPNKLVRKSPLPLGGCSQEKGRVASADLRFLQHCPIGYLIAICSQEEGRVTSADLRFWPNAPKVSVLQSVGNKPRFATVICTCTYDILVEWSPSRSP
jgi:hypothetical protein